MGSFVSIALWGGMGLLIVLMGRQLNLGLKNQRTIETALASTCEEFELERLTAQELAQAQNEQINQLTHSNQALEEQSQEQIAAIAQLKADHKALQEKYNGLERNLLEHLAKGKTLEATLQNYKLANARLQHQTESLQKDKIQREQEQQTLLSHHQQISEKHQKYQQVIQAAKEKISHLNREKKQLERDLQQALYQVVALEKAEKPMHHFIEPSYHEETAYSFREPSLPSFKS